MTLLAGAAVFPAAAVGVVETAGTAATGALVDETMATLVAAGVAAVLDTVVVAGAVVELTFVPAGSDSSTNILSPLVSSPADRLIVSSWTRASSAALNSSMDLANLPLGSTILLKLIICSRAPVADDGCAQPTPILSTGTTCAWLVAATSIQPATHNTTAIGFMLLMCLCSLYNYVQINLYDLGVIRMQISCLLRFELD